MFTHHPRTVPFTLCIAAALANVGPAWGQDVSQPDSDARAPLEEVVVSARKRDETAISVPISLTALSAAEIQNQAIDSYADLAMLVPSLSVTQVSGGIGGSIILRGLGTTAGSNPSFEQTVKVNIDGVELSRGSVLRLGQIDMNRIEILRGPQALFFGKNSPAGVVSIRTNDPGSEFEAMAQVGYEPYAKERMAEAVISGPVTEKLGLRLAVSGSDMDGWMDNLAPGTAAAANALVPNAVTAPIHEAPETTFWLARGTLLWTPADSLELRAKLSYAESDGPGFQQGPNQRIYCPNGAPQVAPQVAGLTTNPALQASLTPILAVDDCDANDTYANGSISPANLVNAPSYADTVEGEGRYTSTVGSAELNWHLGRTMTLTSMSGYAELEEARFDTYSYAPSDSLAANGFGGVTSWEQVSEELRLASDFDGRFNFMVGGYYEDSRLTAFTQQFATPGPHFDQRIDGTALSSFVQATLDITQEVELSGGVRWSREEKDFSVVRDGVPQPVSPANATFENTSPEVTLAWRPSDTLTVFASYRQGFKSGGFATPHTVGPAFTPPGPNNLYRPEKVDGYEVGAHAALFDRQLRVNVAAYTYDYRDLQVNSLDNSSGLPVIRVTNAAAAAIDGVEFDMTWQPDALPDFSINGAVSYNDATFDEFLASCYIGQTQSQGCTVGLNPSTGRYTAQDLTGERLINAPQWTGAVAAQYEGDLGRSGLRYMVSAGTSYKSEYNPHPELAPGALQEEVWFINGGLRIFSDNRGWEVALIGRNLTDQYRVTSASNVPTTGIGTRTGSTLAGGLADLSGYVNRGRELLLQLTVRPSTWR